jgi:hypothetical protein
MEDELDISGRLNVQASVDRAVRNHLLQRAAAEIERMRSSRAELTRYLVVANGGAIAVVLGLVSNLGTSSLRLEDALPSLWLFAAGVIAGGVGKAGEAVATQTAVNRTLEQFERAATETTDKARKRMTRMAFIFGCFEGMSASMFVLGLIWGLLALGRDYEFCLHCAIR